VVVTGATGFIGRHVARRLDELPDLRVVRLGRRDDATADIVCPLERMSGDIWQSAGVNRVDLVVHLAAYTPKSAVDLDHLAPAVETNIVGTLRLLESFPFPPARVVFGSTLDVYGPSVGRVLESTQVAPVGLYGASKLFGEHLIRKWCAATGASWAILRYGHVTGPGEEVYRRFVPEALRRISRGLAPVVYGDGSQLRDLIGVTDAVEATVRAGMRVDENVGPINVVRGESKSVANIVGTLLRLWPASLEAQFDLTRPSGQSFRFDNGLMFEALGRWPLLTWDEMLSQTVEHFRHILAAPNG
jgi:UDP-glucose 4-epimerase